MTQLTSSHDPASRPVSRSTPGQPRRSSAGVRPPAGIVPQACACDPGPPAGYVYSTGVLEPRFPDEGDKREFESRAREEGRPVDDFFSVLSKYRYLARRICWVLNVGERPAGILVPRSEAELSDLIKGLDPEPYPNLDVAVTGTLGSTAPPDKCDGLEVPMIGVTDLSYFTRDALIKKLTGEIQVDPGAGSGDLERTIQRVWTLMGTWRQPGFEDGQRAMNYVALRTTTLYEKTVSLGLKSQGGYWLQTISAQVDSTEDGRSVANVDASYHNASGQSRTFRIEIDVTDLFAFQSKALYEV